MIVAGGKQAEGEGTVVIKDEERQLTDTFIAMLFKETTIHIYICIS